jgi:endonuclease/exonuclease/phosphatase family metal-dependent hydrolase
MPPVPAVTPWFAGLLACALVTACAEARREDAILTLATWNAQWLIEPETFDELARICIGRGGRATGETRSIPCDLVPDGRWSAADFARLRDFVATVPADVFALQEVDGPRTAARVFPGWSFCFTARRHVQNVGFAIRPGVPYRCNDDYRALGLPGNDVRWGADLTLFEGTPRELRLLAVHLKSGCSRDPLTRDSDDCRTLQRQVPVLEEWIDARAAEGRRFAVLGDFNRRFDREFPPGRDRRGHIVAMWPELDDGKPPEADLTDPREEGPALPCRQQDPVRPPVDHILLSASLGRGVVPDSFRVWPYPRGALSLRWPDHCIRSVSIELAAPGR